VVMLRNRDGVWSSLPTTYLGQSGNYHTYTATTPGFSYFAVAVRNETPVQVSPTADVKITVAETIPDAGATALPTAAFTYSRVMAPVTTVSPTVMTEAPTPEGSSGITPFSQITGAIVIILAGSGIWFVRRWWIRQQNPALFRDND